MASPTPSLKLLRIWLTIGLQSFGGGAMTMTLIRRNAVEFHGWVTEEEFNRHWALCQMTPGINLIALAVVIGKQINGARGAAICLFGMLFPSTFVTCLLTAFYLSIQHMPHIQGAMKGVLPATVGLGMVTACGMANQPLRESWARGWKQLLFAVVVITGSGLALWFEKASVTTILIGAALIGALEGVLSNRRGRQ